jgi:TP901 family phage tail tape measure protein
MGEAIGKVSLDVSGVEQGAKKIDKSFDEITKESNDVIKSIQQQAEAFESVLGKAYKSVEQKLSPLQRAQKALNEIFASNKEKVEAYDAAYTKAAQAEYQASQVALKSYQQLLAARQQLTKAQEDYYSKSMAGKHVDANKEYADLLVAIDKVNKAQAAYNVTRESEVQAIAKANAAQKEYMAVLNATKEVEERAQSEMNKLLNENAAVTEKVNRDKIQSANTIRDVNERNSNERHRQLNEEREDLEDTEDAAEDAANSQAIAFGIAANAVHEVINVVKTLTRELFELSKQVLNIGSDFETSMAQVAATSGMTASDIKNNISDYADLVSAAKEAGLTTVFSASQAGEALNYLALAGYNVEESIATMPDILTIAAAGAMDLGRASDMVTDAMNALDLSIDDTSGFIDKMAKTAQSSNTNVEQLGNAILTVGGTATVLAGGVTELDTALGVLANSGIKARQGGTALRQILLNLTDPSEKASKMIEQLGLKVFDMEGNMRPLNEIFTDLNDIMKDFTDQQRMETLGTLFDARQVRAATALMQGMGGAWDDLEEKIDNAKGSAEKMAETMRSNLNGAVNIAKSNIDSLAITIYEGISKNITDLVQSAIPQLQKLNEVLASPEMQSRLESMSAQIKEIGLTILNVIVKAAPNIISFLSNVQANLESLKVIIWAILSIKIVTHIMDIMKALQALYVVLATNPYVAVIAAVAALVIGIQQLTAAVEENHKAMVASIEAENDAYKEQRSQVQGVVDEWNSYKETSGEVTAEAEAQRAKVEALYEEYVRLHNAGEDTTLAMEALANEIPELQQMLADGKTSFEDITGAVNDYCDALIRSAETEAGREGYIEAIKTRNALKGSIDDLKKAEIESGKAADEARKRLESFESVFGTNAFLMSPGAKKEYEELKSKYESATNIYANNAKAYSDAAQTLKEADEAVESSRDMYYKSIQDSAKKEGKAYEDRNAAVRGINEQYSKDQTQFHKDQEAKSKEESQQLADSLAADINGVESLIKQRLATDDDKIKVYEQFFDVDHTDWDRTCADLVDAYDEYMTLREKKEKEVRDQMEKDQKERDKLAKEAQQKSEKAAKEAEDKWVKSINKGLSDIEWLAGYKDWDSDKLAQAYKDYLDENAEYYEKHAEARESLERKILETEKKSDEERAKDAKKSAEEYVKNWTSGYDKLVDRAVKAYQQLEKDANNYRQNLLKGVELTATETKKVWDMASHSYKDEQVEVVSAKSLQEDLEQMRKVKAFLDDLRKQGADQSLIDQFMGSSSEDQQKFMEQFTKMSSGERSKYLSTWKDLQETADSMTEEYMSKRVSDWEKNFWQPVQAYTQTGGTKLQEAMKLVGEDSVQGWLDGIAEKQTEAEGKTKELYGSVLDDAKKTLGIASPSKEFYAIGEYSIQGFLDGLTSKVSEVASVFQSLGQTAGDKFINAFKSTWDSFVTLLNNTGGLQIPVNMTTTTFGTPTVQGSQVYYTGTGTSYSGLTKADVISAIKEAVPDGNVVLQVDEAEFGRVSRSSLNLLAEQQGTMDLRV